MNGSLLGGVYEAEIHSNAYLGADRFTFQAALNATEGLTSPTLPLQIVVEVGLDGAWRSLITGQADSLEIDPIRGCVTITGRDGTAVFISSQTHESFENLTSSDVANLLAQRHGLSASVASTTTLIGRFYQAGHTRSAFIQHGRATTEWDMLCWLAQQEGYDVWMSGTTLNFQPALPGSSTITVTPEDCTAMRLDRDLTIGLGFTVEIQSWDCSSQSVVAEDATHASGASGSKLIALRPNLSSTDAQSLAQRTAAQLASHERSLNYDMPADLGTMPRMVVQLSGTQTDFDGAYVVYEIERRFSVRHGFTQHVQARQSSWTGS